MKGKKLAAKIMLGLLLATPYSAFANSIGTVTVDGKTQNVYVNDDFVIGKDNVSSVNITVPTGPSLKISDQTNGMINGQDITLNGGISITSGDKNTPCGTVTIGTNGVTNTVTINGGAKSDGLFIRQGHVNIAADNINISTDDSNGSYGAIWIQNITQYETAPKGAASVTLNADNININSGNLGIVAFSNSQVNINGDLTVDADHAIDTRGNATININTDGAHTTVLNGDIVFETPNTPGNPQNSGNLINSNVNINFNGEGSSFNGSAYKTYPDSGVEGDYMIDHNDNDHYGNVTDFNLTFDNGAAWNMTNDSFVNNVNLSNGGVINVQENAERFNADKADMNEGVINLQGEKQNVNVGTLTGTNGTVNVASADNKLAITKSNSIDSLTVAANGAYAEELVQNDINESLNALANQVVDNTADGEGKTAATDVAISETGVVGEITAEVGEDGKVIAGSVKELTNSTTAGIGELANVAFMAWRAENDEMHQRMGELRSSKGEAGIWARMKRGESESGDLNIKNQYSTYQLGYDEKVGDSNWYLGGAISRTEGKSSFGNGSGENQSTGFTVYGTYVGEDGQYVDLSAKYARLDNEFDVFGRDGIESTGDYRNNGYAFSAEYGKRIEAGNEFWVEPQVQLTYGHLSSADYTTSRGIKAAQDAMNSVVGRVGFAAGKDIGAGNVYVKASYLYDFDGDTSVTMNDGVNSRTYEQDLGGGWFEFGIGTNINLSETSHLYFDVERAVGGDIDTPWQWNAGVRFDF